MIGTLILAYGVPTACPWRSPAIVYAFSICEIPGRKSGGEARVESLSTDKTASTSTAPRPSALRWVRSKQLSQVINQFLTSYYGWKSCVQTKMIREWLFRALCGNGNLSFYKTNLYKKTKQAAVISWADRGALSLKHSRSSPDRDTVHSAR